MSEKVHDAVIWKRGGAVFDALRPNTEPEGYKDIDQMKVHRLDHLRRVRSIFEHFSTDIDTDGVGLQVSTEDGYRIVDDTDTIVLHYQNAAVGPQSFPGLEAIQAGSDGAGGYNVLSSDGADFQVVWDVDDTGAWTGSHVDDLINFEDRFAFDINGDGEIGFF